MEFGRTNNQQRCGRVSGKIQTRSRLQAGEGFKYCNTNYSLLALIAEKATGEKFRDFVAKNIFEPLGMKRTRFLSPPPGNYKTIPNLTKNYIADTEGREYFTPEEIPPYKNAAAPTYF